MDREEIRSWLETHPQSLSGTPEEQVAWLEAQIRAHAELVAWRRAEDYVATRMHAWEQQWGFHASESFVAGEVCRMLAAHLRAREPHVREGDEAELLGRKVLEGLDPETRERVARFARELGARIEHDAWREIVRFTRREGRRLVREGRVSTASDWEATENWARKAAHVAELLLHDLEREARGRMLRAP